MTTQSSAAVKAHFRHAGEEMADGDIYDEAQVRAALAARRR